MYAYDALSTKGDLMFIAIFISRRALSSLFLSKIMNTARSRGGAGVGQGWTGVVWMQVGEIRLVRLSVRSRAWRERAFPTLACAFRGAGVGG